MTQEDIPWGRTQHYHYGLWCTGAVAGHLGKVTSQQSGASGWRLWHRGWSLLPKTNITQAHAINHHLPQCDSILCAAPAAPLPRIPHVLTEWVPSTCNKLCLLQGLAGLWGLWRHFWVKTISFTPSLFWPHWVSDQAPLGLLKSWAVKMGPVYRI